MPEGWKHDKYRLIQYTTSEYFFAKTLKRFRSDLIFKKTVDKE